jgi:hypothetical protein
MPDISRQHLTELMEYICPPGMLAGATKPQPLLTHQQSTIWATTNEIFVDLIKDHFLCLFRDQLSIITATREQSEEGSGLLEALQAAEGTFSLIEWRDDYLEHVQQAIRAVLQQAATAGLKAVVETFVAGLQMEQGYC